MKESEMLAEILRDVEKLNTIIKEDIKIQEESLNSSIDSAEDIELPYILFNTPSNATDSSNSNIVNYNHSNTIQLLSKKNTLQQSAKNIESQLSTLKQHLNK